MKLLDVTQHIQPHMENVTHAIVTHAIHNRISGSAAVDGHDLSWNRNSDVYVCDMWFTNSSHNLMILFYR